MVAVMVALPLETGVSLPFWSTATTSLLLLVQVMVPVEPEGEKFTRKVKSG